MRSEKGITLVALIAVFILLIILAGISISLVLTDTIEKQPAIVASNTVIQENIEETNDNVVEENENNETIENTVEDNTNNTTLENVVEE